MNEDKTMNQDKLSEDEIAQILQKSGPLIQPPEDMAQRVKAAVKTSWTQEVETRSNPWIPRLAAAIAICAVGGFIALQPTTNPIMTVAKLDSNLENILISNDSTNWYKPERFELAENIYVRVNGVTPISMTFANGMNLRAKPDTIIQLSHADEVRLTQGSVYLDSYHKTDGPFLVTTSFGSARDIGTQFMVEANETNWSIQVREGEVNVADDDFNQQLSAGEFLTITAAEEVSTKAMPAHDDSWQWTENARPDYDLNGKKLDDYLIWVARETGRELHYRSDNARKSAAETRLGGRSISHKTASESLVFVLQTTHLRVIEDAENAIMVDLAID
jgi:hypothetical protein